MFFLFEKPTDTLIEQTKSRPQETLDLKMNKQMETFSFNPPVNLVEEGKRFLAVTSFEATNAVFKITNENKRFLILTHGFWSQNGSEEIINVQKEILELQSQIDIELYVKEVKKRGTRIEIENSGYNLAGFDHSNSEILAELKKVQYKDLEDMVYRTELTYDEKVDILEIKYIDGSIFGYVLPT